ncbi:C40 family peptidase [Roseivivax sediminis]|uniref:Permuted papain-like amidase enzyme, YaeF/YiiX, C92 family n=1 Tax=Roseivivax sediminis TaxID=936889 RepID=A0A1I2A327_9RHOB|nr:lipo-like protein [Roseivivax sediminis]SFE37968.1 Permuted papain-like amidase enzyme, YaeF/YiiX, C92 family [Roseivivax sediminis]
MTDTIRTRLDAALRSLGLWLAARITRNDAAGGSHVPSDFARLREALQPGDVLLVDGQSLVGQTVKYLTQSTWSHAALYVGDAAALGAPTDARHELVEVNLGEGCVSAPLSKYARYHTRICRPVGLSDADRARVAQFMTERIGLRYDMRNIFDLARYVMPKPPLPGRLRRRMLALGSGDPTRAICSSLIAQAFQTIGYPILPRVREVKLRTRDDATRRELLHIRHHSLYVPGDFDLSPYFEIVKPQLAAGFDPGLLAWAHQVPDEVGGAEALQFVAE